MAEEFSSAWIRIRNGNQRIFLTVASICLHFYRPDSQPVPLGESSIQKLDDLDIKRNELLTKGYMILRV